MYMANSVVEANSVRNQQLDPCTAFTDEWRATFLTSDGCRKDLSEIVPASNALTVWQEKQLPDYGRGSYFTQIPVLALRTSITKQASSDLNSSWTPGALGIEEKGLCGD